MSQFSITSLNKITIGKYSKYFDLDYNANGVQKKNAVFVASVEPNNQIDSNSVNSKTNTANIYSIFIEQNQNVIHAMYDIKDVCIQSNIKDSYGKFVDVYAPDIENDPLGIAQLNNFTYCMTQKSRKLPYYSNTTLYSLRQESVEEIRDLQYENVYLSKDITLNLYDTKKLFDVGNTLIGKTCNYILELQTNQYYNDFEEGNVYGDVFIAKNFYDYSYSMNMENATSLNEERQYVGLGQCGNNIYLKYFDNKAKQSKQTYNYQKIETIGGINRFSDNTLHRSNMYSLKIENIGLNSLDINSKMKALKQQIILDIGNSIKEIVKDVCPANTQLLKVEYVD